MKLETIKELLNGVLQEVKETVCLFAGHNWKYLEPTIFTGHITEERVCKRCNKEQSKVMLRMYEHGKFKSENGICLKCKSITCNPDMHDDFSVFPKWL